MTAMVETFNNEEEPLGCGRIFVAMLVIGAFILILLVVASLGATVPNQHALKEHGSYAVTVMQCKVDNGVDETWFNPSTNRYANLIPCDPQWGIEITEANGDQVTTFVKEKMKRIEQVYNYLRNRGYLPPGEY